MVPLTFVAIGWIFHGGNHWGDVGHFQAPRFPDAQPHVAQHRAATAGFGGCDLGGRGGYGSVCSGAALE